MQDLIARFDAWLSRNAPEYYAALHPGMSEAQLDELETKLGIALPDDLRQLYAWRNGCRAGDASDDPLLYSHLLPDRVLLEEWGFMTEMADSGGFDLVAPPVGGVANWWDRRWIPFLLLGEGDYLCVDTCGSYASEGGVQGQLIACCHEADYREITYASIAKWLETVVTVLEHLKSHKPAEPDWRDSYADLTSIWRKTYLRLNPGYPRIFRIAPGETEPHLRIEE